MVQATTPTFVLTLPDTVDLTEPIHFYFTLRQGPVRIEKADSDLVVDGQTISVYLSQAETLTLTPGIVKLQLNWTYTNGSRAASEIVSVSVTENLLKEVIA